MFASCTRAHAHAGDVVHVPANDFTLFPGSTGGRNVPSNVAAKCRDEELIVKTVVVEVMGS